jgi:hypothetical protein
MKNLKKSFALILIVLVCGSFNSLAQHGGGHGGRGGGQGGNHRNRGGGVVIQNNRNPNRVIVRSVYRPNRIIVFHPYWGMKRNFNRRWVYFPRYNFYWDNWRNCYVYRNGNVWITNTVPPPTIVNININNEKHYELKEHDDDEDDVYKSNDTHQTEYKPE